MEDSEGCWSHGLPGRCPLSLIILVRRIPRYAKAETFFGFADQAAADAWVEADKATRRPGRMV
jgi:hypothetical protein